MLSGIAVSILQRTRTLYAAEAMNIYHWLRLWFGLSARVSRLVYGASGVGFMVFKYLVEALTLLHYTGKTYTPLDFVNPLLSVREQFTVGAPPWLGMAWVLWTLPFVWIAVSMSIRRSVDAGVSPWNGMLMLVPLVNFVWMLYLAAIPSSKQSPQHEGELFETRQSDGGDKQELRSHHAVLPAAARQDSLHVRTVQSFNAALVGVGVGLGYMFAVALLSIYAFDSYSTALFFGTPIVGGATGAYFYNRWCPRPLAATLLHSMLVVLCFSLCFLLFGLEGMLCIAMAAPIMVPFVLLGALVGHTIAKDQHESGRSNDNGLAGCLLVLPLLAGVETLVDHTPTFEVMTNVEIDASPERVWECVVSFPEITETPEWFFRLGIACPDRARIEGQGVGAVRHCEFTTGAFVEPITVWDEPSRLAFDVTEQPEPMFELTPYRHIHPPHLDGSFRSTRGEFRLVELADGRTRLEGSTWYQLEIYPHAYWTVWTDALVHRIHKRVLQHIKRIAELDQPSGIATHEPVIIRP